MATDLPWGLVTPKIGSEGRHNGVKEDVYGLNKQALEVRNGFPLVETTHVTLIPKSHFNNIHFKEYFSRPDDLSRATWTENVTLPTLIQQRLWKRRQYALHVCDTHLLNQILAAEETYKKTLR